MVLKEAPRLPQPGAPENVSTLSRGALSGFELGLGQANGALTFLPLTALLHELNALETLENRTLAADGTSSLECGVLRHIFVFGKG